MPQNTYRVTDPKSGRTVRLTGDSPPTEAELEQVFATLPAQPTQQQAQPTQAPSEGGGVLEGAKNFAIGALKAPLNWVKEGGEAIRSAIPALDALPSAHVPINPEAQGGMQKAGQITADLAMSVIPGARVAKALTGASLPIRMAAEAATSGAVSRLQGGDATTGAVMGAAAPLVGGVLGTRAATSLRESAEKKVAQALGATKERFKAIAEKRAPEIIARGLGGTRSQLLKDATERAREAGAAIDDVLKGSGERPVSTQSVIDALEEAKAGFTISRELSIPEAIRSGQHRVAGARPTPNGRVSVPVVLDQRPIDQLTKLQDTIRALGDEATVEQLVATRRVWDDVVGRAGGYAHRSGSAFGVPLAEQTEAWAKREATKAIRQALAADVPDLAKVNKEYAFWKDLKDVLTATERRTQAQGPGLSRVVMATVGAGSGYSSGDTMGERVRNAAFAGLVGPRVLAGLQSAKWKFVDARLRNALADALESGSPGRVAGAAARIAAVSSGRAASPSTDESAQTPTAPGQR